MTATTSSNRRTKVLWFFVCATLSLFLPFLPPQLWTSLASSAKKTSTAGEANMTDLANNTTGLTGLANSTRWMSIYQLYYGKHEDIVSTTLGLVVGTVTWKITSFVWHTPDKKIMHTVKDTQLHLWLTERFINMFGWFSRINLSFSFGALVVDVYTWNSSTSQISKLFLIWIIATFVFIAYCLLRRSFFFSITDEVQQLLLEQQRHHQQDEQQHQQQRQQNKQSEQQQKKYTLEDLERKTETKRG